MLRERGSLTLEMQKVLDIVITGFSFIGAYFIKRHLLPGKLSDLSTDPNYYIILLLIIITWYISFKWMGMYMSYRQQPFWPFFTTIFKSCLLGIILVNITLYFLHIQNISRLLMGIFLALNISLLTLSKFIIFKILEKIRTDGLNTRNILVVGSKERAKDLIVEVEKYKSTGYRLLGCFDVEEERLGQTVVNGHKVIGLVQNLEAYLRDNIVDELIFAMPLKLLEKVDRSLAFAESLGINVRIIPDW
jgi:FlaA1/EpsC-like NDP-sugar epimerase